MTAKIPDVGAGVASGTLLGKKEGCGREEEVVQIGQQTRKVTDGVSVICPNNRKWLTFVGQDDVGWQHVSDGMQDVLMNELHLSNDPHSVATFSNLFGEEGCMDPVFVDREVPSETR